MGYWEGSLYGVYLCLFLVSKGLLGLLSDCGHAEWGKDRKTKWEEETSLRKCPYLCSEPPTWSLSWESKIEISKQLAQYEGMIQELAIDILSFFCYLFHFFLFLFRKWKTDKKSRQEWAPRGASIYPGQGRKRPHPSPHQAMSGSFSAAPGRTAGQMRPMTWYMKLKHPAPYHCQPECALERQHEHDSKSNSTSPDTSTAPWGHWHRPRFLVFSTKHPFLPIANSTLHRSSHGKGVASISHSFSPSLIFFLPTLQRCSICLAWARGQSLDRIICSMPEPTDNYKRGWLPGFVN